MKPTKPDSGKIKEDIATLQQEFDSQESLDDPKLKELRRLANGCLMAMTAAGQRELAPDGIWRKTEWFLEQESQHYEWMRRTGGAHGGGTSH